MKNFIVMTFGDVSRDSGGSLHDAHPLRLTSSATASGATPANLLIANSNANKNNVQMSNVSQPSLKAYLELPDQT